MVALQRAARAEGEPSLPTPLGCRNSLESGYGSISHCPMAAEDVGRTDSWERGEGTWAASYNIVYTYIMLVRNTYTCLPVIKLWRNTCIHRGQNYRVKPKPLDLLLPPGTGVAVNQC
jgi:hypothetical protein